jgi:hypothetical protein
MEYLIEVDGKQITKEQFEEMKKNFNIKIVETSPGSGKFKTLTKFKE